MKETFAAYPTKPRRRLRALRTIILDVARACPDIDAIEETLKWGEPSYLAKSGSTLRMDWKEKAPDQIALYFKCTSKLVVTFREVFGDEFTYEKNRALLFGLDEDLDSPALRQCIEVTLRYHKVKQLDALGLTA